MDVRFYVSASGRSPVEKYLAALPARERALVLDVFEEVRLHGFASPFLDARQVEGKLWEIRASRHRVFYVTIAGPVMVLLHAYKKEGQKAPRGEIDVARSRMKEVQDG